MRLKNIIDLKQETSSINDQNAEIEEYRQKLISAQKRENDSKVKVIAYQEEIDRKDEEIRNL